LLRGSFRPTAAIAALRAYLRHRETLVQSAATHAQRMQKALLNLQLPVVISDITGVTGRRIRRDISGGQTDPHALAQHRDHRYQASAAEITAALTGHYRPEHVFVLQQNLALFDAYQGPRAGCDAEAHVLTPVAQTPAPSGSLPAPRTRKTPRDNEPRVEIRTPLHQLTGVDLTRIDAIGPYRAPRRLAEIGTDLSRWPTEKHFTSWLTLARPTTKSPAAGGDIQAWLAGNRDGAWLRPVFVLPVATAGSRESPAIGLKQSDQLADFHARVLVAAV
jgi:hypothetical protein